MTDRPDPAVEAAAAEPERTAGAADRHPPRRHPAARDDQIDRLYRAGPRGHFRYRRRGRPCLGEPGAAPSSECFTLPVEPPQAHQRCRIRRIDPHTGAVTTFATGLSNPTALAFDALTNNGNLRWQIVVRLAVLGALDEEEIMAEAARDPSDLGQRRAWTARASLPDPARKAAAFAARQTQPASPP